MFLCSTFNSRQFREWIVGFGFDSINVGGIVQTTYKGWPLYYFGADNNVMVSNKGISVPLPVIWLVLVMNIPAAP